MSDNSNVEKWTKVECVKFLRTVKGAKLTGNKCELISRVKGYIQHPDILNSIQTSPEITLETALDINSLNESCLQWNSGREHLPFVNFETVERYVKTREQAAQALQEKGYRMFASRKIVNIQTATVNENALLLKAFVRPSMENKPARPLWILFTENKPSKAFCRCPAGMSGLCCHVSATLYALEEHSRTSNLTLELACTSKLQTWHKNKPWRGKLTEISNIKVESAKKKVKPQQREAREIAKKVKKCLLKSTPSCAPEVQRELRFLHCLNSTNTKSSIYNVLSHRYASIVKHDHDYCKVGVPDYDNEELQHNRQNISDENCTQPAYETTSTLVKIEQATRGQRSNPLWHAYRQYRITSSLARKLLHSTEHGRPNLINKIMNIQTVQNEENIPPSLLYGIQNEARARARYTEITGRVVEECGCYIDGILLASPDGYIPELDHLLEIKGLASQRNQPVIQAVKERQLEKSYPYAIDVHGKLHLKIDNTRGYYEQVQMQMGLSGKQVVEFVVFSDVDQENFQIEYNEAFFLDLKSKLLKWYEVYIQPLLTSEKCPKLQL